MKRRIASLALLTLCMATIPVLAQNDIYNDGPTNGTTDAWTFNFGFTPSDSFIVPTGGATINGVNFAAWLTPGDVLESAEVTFTQQELGGTVYFDQQVNFTQSGCVLNQYGYNVCTETGSFPGVSLNAGAYWMTLQNGVVNTGDPVYWDENSGPSSASESILGTIPSESFTLLGRANSGGTTPEPSSILLFGSGILGLAGVLRRRLF
jgi:hypothetical protein